MPSVVTVSPDHILGSCLSANGSVHYQCTPYELVQDCLRRKEGCLDDEGALVIETGEFTGRSPRDRYIVKDGIIDSTINWNDFNQPIDERYFETIFRTVTDYLNNLEEFWIRDSNACADPRYKLNIRIISETPAINLFAYNMFLRPGDDELEMFAVDWHVLSAPALKLDPGKCGTRQQNAVVISFKHKMILYVGGGYTGEIKKAIFSVLNYILPTEKNVLGMHCAANMGVQGDTALFFGLSGTGKTTLSADSNRTLIGDDEHGWTSTNIFNFEGGCYAKCIHLSSDKEPAIYAAIRPGALVENIRFYPKSNRINFDDGSITENTRVSYPLHYISNTLSVPVGNIPRNIFFLTCDAYGVLPPISRLTTAQAMYHFISGYTAKVAGTEAGISEPKATFSACFGAPFMPLHPGKYAGMLGDRIRKHNVKVWLVNTGWTGGPYGTGERIRLGNTRAMIAAALEGKLNAVKYYTHPVFGTTSPVACPGVPFGLLNPRDAWSDPKAYDEMALNLGCQFRQNFEKYKSGVSQEILEAGPVI